MQRVLLRTRKLYISVAVTPGPEFNISCRLGRELFTFRYCCRRCHGVMGCDQERVTHRIYAIYMHGENETLKYSSPVIGGIHSKYMDINITMKMKLSEIYIDVRTCDQAQSMLQI